MATPSRILSILFLTAGLWGGFSLAHAQEASQVERLVMEDWTIETWSEIDPQGLEQARYRLSQDGLTFTRDRDARFVLRMQAGTFDPLEAVPIYPEALQVHGDLHIVQFITPSIAPYRKALQDLGATVHHPLHYQAHLVEMTASAAGEVAKLPFVRYVGPYQAGYRIEPAILENLASLPKDQRYHIQVLQRGLSQKQRVAERLIGLGGTIEAMIPDGFLLAVEMSPELVLEAATWDEVLWIDRLGEFEDDMSRVRIDSGADIIESNLGFTGAGLNAEVMDGNVQVDHPDFQSPPLILHGPNVGTGTHGTKCAGVVFGDGTGSANARGMLPDAQPIFADYGQLSNRYTHTAELLQAPYEAVFQSNSWGSTRTTIYNSVSMQMDDILFLNDIVILQSQSNEGNQDSRPQAWAKNVVAVGGIRHQNTQSLADDTWAGAGSIGPAQDGRIKPDISYWYDSIRTTTTDSGYTNTFGGTSAATPMSAGAFGIFFQMWHEELFGNDAASTIFESRPKATTARAMMINSARSYDFSGTNDDLTRVHQGWGRANVEDLWNHADEYLIVDEDQVMENLDTATYLVTVPAGTPDLRVTMIYLDPAGTTSSAMHRINDLSLRVTSPGGGSSYWGNNGLLTGNWSTPGGTSNDLDVVENVFVQNPTAGVWTIEVIADEIIQDAHTETPAIDADFALVVRGVEDDSPVITNFCFPGAPNSTGFPAVLSGDFSSPTGTGLHLEANLGPATEFGYFLIGTTAIDPGLALSNGFLCLDASAGSTLARYNFGSGELNSIGQFDAAGVLQNLSSTSSVGTGFDVPTALPGIPGTIMASSTWHFQLWYRDGPGQSNLTNGVSVTF